MDFEFLTTHMDDFDGTFFVDLREGGKFGEGLLLLFAEESKEDGTKQHKTHKGSQSKQVEYPEEISHKDTETT